MMKGLLLILAIGSVSASSPALVETVSETENDAEIETETLANTFVNEVSTQEWSKLASEFAVPSPQLEVSDDLTPKVEAWYINHAEDVDRKECMEKQLTNAGYTPYRFSAMESVSTDDFNKCVENGIEDLPQTANLRQTVSNWCNHKRLFEGLAKSPSDAEYFLVLEDTPVVNTKRMKNVVDDLIAEYRQQKWSFLQLDPYGGVGNPTSFHRGMPIYQPSYDVESNQAYQGTHALLVKRSALAQITQLMNKRKATELTDVVMQTPSFLAVSAGVAINPMVNKHQEYVPLPEFCQAKEKASSFIQGDFTQQETADDDLWAKWPRATAPFSMAQTAWWTPAAKSWHSVSMAEQGKYEKISTSAAIETFQIGTADEDPARANCMNQAFRAVGLGKPKRIELLQVSSTCSSKITASDYQACLAKTGMEDCSSAGWHELSDIDDADFDRRVKIRDHVVAGTCSFKRALKEVKGEGSPYVLMVNENAILEQQNMKKKLLDFVENYKKPWSAIQLDPYGREEPVEAGSIWTPAKATDEQAKSRFYGLHAVLLKRDAVPMMLAELNGASGPVDRIPRQTSGWVSANLGVAYDPNMAALTGMDGCSKYPSRASHFQVTRAEIPENWGSSVKKAMTVEADLAQESMEEEEDVAMPRSARK